MFTGIVTATGRIRSFEPISGGARLLLEAISEPWENLQRGESVAVNGVCLTLVEPHSPADDVLAFDVIEETLRASALGDSRPGARVNLERALRLGDRFGGHYVTGHVDAIGRITEFAPGGGETQLRVFVENSGSFRVIPKGSVTVDGISLTVVDAALHNFSVALIPHTLEVTHLRDRQPGDRVNLEMDPIGKWVQFLMKSEV